MAFLVHTFFIHLTFFIARCIVHIHSQDGSGFMSKKWSIDAKVGVKITQSIYRYGCYVLTNCWKRKSA